VSPNQRTLAECRRRGWLPGIVERRLPRGFTTIDLYGFIDVVVLDGKQGILGIQVTSGSNGGSRLRKIREERAAEARRWLEAGNRIEVWAWRKVGAAGSRKLWEPRVVRVVLRPTIDETLRDLPI
jgi:hypothetical protein